MTPPLYCVGPPWPPPLQAYDYLSRLTWRDWAWEGLRRNRTYQAEALRTLHLTGHASKNWEVERFSRGCRSVCSLLKRGRSAAFADPARHRPGSASRLASGGRHIGVPGRSRALVQPAATEDAGVVLPRLAEPRAHPDRLPRAPARRIARQWSRSPAGRSRAPTSLPDLWPHLSRARSRCASSSVRSSDNAAPHTVASLRTVGAATLDTDDTQAARCDRGPRRPGRRRQLLRGRHRPLWHRVRRAQLANRTQEKHAPPPPTRAGAFDGAGIATS